ncbi:DUF2306 domain-containing protein [Gangjinia marincola]|uniref:DUF2306 domain-containing protein n=1 Tax=Gangjinia marincola TaxID=578463 RepID=UPI0031DC2A52
MPHDLIGWIHTFAAFIALLTGSIVLTQTKGTRLHKRIGRVYAVAMLIVCATAFMIYRLHNTFGILHIFAVISTITLVLGMLPFYLKSTKNPVLTHLAWMYWSVIGLYCAFTAELFTRLPMLLNLQNSYGIFYMLVGVSTGAVGMMGSLFFRRQKKMWETIYTANTN